MCRALVLKVCHCSLILKKIYSYFLHKCYLCHCVIDLLLFQNKYFLKISPFYFLIQQASVAITHMNISSLGSSIIFNRIKGS